MEGEGIEESRSLSGTPRWVDGRVVASDQEIPPWPRMEVENFRNEHGSGMLRKKLVKKVKRVDSLDAEAMQIAGSHGHQNQVLLLSLYIIEYCTCAIIEA